MRRDDRDAACPEGMLVLVIGDSGAGKDTLIDAARSHFAGNETFVFPRRVITRAAQIGEVHLAVGASEFQRLEAAGGLCVAWAAHGNKYGIPIHVIGELEDGRIVVVNISRTAIEAIREIWPRLRLVQVTAEPGQLRRRLRARNRELPGEIENRMRRDPNILVPRGTKIDRIDNSETVEIASEQFVALLRQYEAERA